MVAMNCRSFNSFIIVASTLVVYLSCASRPSEAARPLNLDGPITKGMEVFLFEEGSVKGLGGIKAHSGPSPAEGYSLTLGLGGIKHSGPAPGQGNRHIDGASRVAVLGGIKNSAGSVSWCSPFIQSIKHSGPAPGGGH
ncbi:unnamed protein product [Linum trigynum]|uniref:Dirigent protein n=1 Tax=Linum trigynum TaxID=586398 RepID=A0AAV2GMX6_9ROSI